MSLRVYISVDIEGMEGVVSYNETLRGKGDYELARRRLRAQMRLRRRRVLQQGFRELLSHEPDEISVGIRE